MFIYLDFFPFFFRGICKKGVCLNFCEMFDINLTPCICAKGIILLLCSSFFLIRTIASDKRGYPHNIFLIPAQKHIYNVTYKKHLVWMKAYVVGTQ